MKPSLKGHTKHACLPPSRPRAPTGGTLYPRPLKEVAQPGQGTTTQHYRLAVGGGSK